MVKVTKRIKNYRALQQGQSDARSIQSDFTVLEEKQLLFSIVCFAEHANSGGPGYQLHFTDSGNGDTDKCRESAETQEFYFEFNMGPANAQIPISVYLEGWTAMAAILLAKSASSPSAEQISSANTIGNKCQAMMQRRNAQKRQQYMQEPYVFSGKSTHCMFKIIRNTFSTLADDYASMFVFVVLALHAQVVFFQMLSGRVPSEDGSVRGIFQEGADTFLHMFFCW